MGPVREEMGERAGRKEWLWNKLLLVLRPLGIAYPRIWAIERAGRLS